jgi:hypothetical protein
MPRSLSNSKSSNNKSFSNSNITSKKDIVLVPNTPKESTVQHKIEQPSFLSNVIQGFAWGTGTSIARNIFESKTPHEQPRQEQSKNEQSKVEINCNTYDLCKKMNDPFDCYSKMNIREYEHCSSK